jgi:hypothetical protein
MQSKHLIFSILILLAIIFSSCSSSNCDCSYEAFNRIKERMTVNQVNRLLKTEPFKSTQIEYWSYYGYKCDENVITIGGDDNRVAEKAFNSPLYYESTKIDFK